MDEALQHLRATAAGAELDEELAAQFPIKEQRILEIPGEDEPIKLFIYEPLEREPNGPVIINAHSGGFVKGYRGRDIVLARNMAFHTQCLYIDVDYHTAPEKRFPYAIHEIYATVKYISEHAAEFSIDPEKIILMGESSGGNMATATCMIAAEKKEFNIRQLILAYPPMDLSRDPMTKPLAKTPDGERLAKNGQKYDAWYADPEMWTNSHVSPLLASKEELCGLPSTLLFTGGLDLLGAEAEDFALLLIRAGVTVTARQLPDAKHAFLTRREGGFEIAEELIFETVEKIKKI